MKKITLFIVTLITVFTLASCTNDEPCGEGTHLEGEICVLDDDSNQLTGSEFCSDDTGLHTVKGASPYTISEWLNWTFIGGHLVNDPDNAWIIDYGAAMFDVKTVAPKPWEGSFTQSGMFLTKGCEYTFSFKLRTESPNVKPDVIVFGENTSGFSFFQETVDLELESTVYEFTVVPTTSDYVSTGVYFANSIGIVIIEEIQITRDEVSGS